MAAQKECASSGSSSSANASTILPAQPKWARASPRDPVGSIRDPRSSNRPAAQAYGEPVQARLQPRLEDPQWQVDHAARTDNRKAMLTLAQQEGKIATEGRTFNPVVPISGLPVPPAAALGSATIMESHFQTYSPDHKIAANFNPSMHTMVVCGRPVQLIIVSHEKAAWLERDQYVPWLFRPLPGIVLDGYTAGQKNAPKGHKHYCVIRWFQVIFL